MKLAGIRPYIKDVHPYVAGKTIEEVKREYHLDCIIKLGSNENPWGPYPAAVEAMRQEVTSLHTYPDNSFIQIKRQIAGVYGVDEQWVAVSHGAGGMLETLAKTFIEPGSHVLIPEYTYGLYREISRLMGGEVEQVPMTADMRIDLQALKRRLRPETRVIWLCNPNNPTGTVVPTELLEKLLTELPEGCWLVLDEAYAEFADDGRLPDRVELISRELPLVSVRTFSKAYGLAGARLGYALAHPDMTRIIDTVAEPFNANRIGLAGAKATLERELEAVTETIATIRRQRERLQHELSDRGCSVYPSQANFILFDTGHEADELAEKMLRRGVIVRSAAGWGLPTHIRVTVGKPEENTIFLETLDAVMRNSTEGEQNG
ncbi:MAG: histidinol-phosphate transaminase [Spirochaetota bacterium]